MLKSGQSFKRGDIIVTDTTLAHALYESETANYCAYCITRSDHLSNCAQCKRVYYCNRQCQKAGWKFGHRGECKAIAETGILPSDTLRLLLALITTEKYKDASIFDSFVSHHGENLKDPETKSQINQTYASLLFITQMTLPISRRDFEILFCKVKTNAFAFWGEHGKSIGAALFRWAAKFDHACKPNAECIFVGRRMKVVALEDMDDWTKARISYVDRMLPTEERQKFLQSKFFFRCDCELCEDVQQDLEVRIPICCGKERLMGPRPATEYLSENPSRLVAFPPLHLRLLPSLKPHSCLDPAEVFVCRVCNKVYAAPVLEAFQKRVYELEDKYADALELYKTCVAADEDAEPNYYFRLFFRHQDSMLMAYLCRTVICKWAGWKDCEMDEDADLVLDCSERAIRWLQAHTSMRDLFIYYVCQSYLTYLSCSILLLKAKLGQPSCHIYNRPRLNHFIDAYRSALPVLMPCMLFYSQHLPGVDEKLSLFMAFAHVLAVDA